MSCDKLKKHNLPALDGEVLSLRWVATTNDWYAEVKGKGWFWLRGDGGPIRKWIPSVYGPYQEVSTEGL